jgi:hypothetical protein
MAAAITSLLVQVLAVLLPLLASMLAGKEAASGQGAATIARKKDDELQAAANAPRDRAALAARLRAGTF